MKPSVDEILDSVTLYWLTESFPTAIYTYRQSWAPYGSSHDHPDFYITKPLAFSWFPYELMPIPIAWVRRTGNLVYYKRHDRIGHFAAMEAPDVLMNDVEEFVNQAWPQASKL